MSRYREEKKGRETFFTSFSYQVFKTDLSSSGYIDFPSNRTTTTTTKMNTTADKMEQQVKDKFKELCVKNIIPIEFRIIIQKILNGKKLSSEETEKAYSIYTLIKLLHE